MSAAAVAAAAAAAAATAMALVVTMAVGILLSTVWGLALDSFFYVCICLGEVRRTFGDDSCKLFVCWVANSWKLIG